MCYITFALLFLIWAGLACFGKSKSPFTPKVKWISLRLKEMEIHICTIEDAAQMNPLAAAILDYMKNRTQEKKVQHSSAI